MNLHLKAYIVLANSRVSRLTHTTHATAHLNVYKWARLFI